MLVRIWHPAIQRPDQQEEAVAEALIRQRVDDLVTAVRSKNIDAVISLYAPGIVSFDIVPPLRYAGAEKKRREWQRTFAAYRGPLGYEVRELTIETHDELGFVHSVNHVNGTLANGQL